MAERARAYVALGSNLGDRAGALLTARVALARRADTHVMAASRIWETEPVGPPGQGEYLNAVLVVETTLGARDLLERMLDIERGAGRDRPGESARWGPRILDLDLLIYADEHIDEPGLEVPHPRLHERTFVLEPLCEVAPELVHPTLGGTMRSHRARCQVDGQARPWRGASTWQSSQ